MSRRNWRAARPVIGLLAGAIALAACGSSGASGGSGGAGKTITILMAAPLSGDYAETGEDMVHGAQLAASYINSLGGITSGPMKGAHLAITTADDQLSTQLAATIAEKYVDDPSIWALDGFIASGSVLPAAQIATRAGLVVYSPFSCADFLTTEVHNVVVTCTKLESLGSATLDFAATNFSAKTISVFMPEYSFEDDIWTGIENHAAGLGVTVNRVSYPGSQSDFSALLTDVEQQKPDVIGVADYQATAGLIVSQARAAGITTPIVDMLCEGWVDTYYKAAGSAAANNTYGCETQPRSFPDGSFGAKILKLWDAQHPNYPMTSPAMHGFDSVNEIAATIDAGAASRTDLQKFIGQINGAKYGLSGLLGPIEMVDLRPAQRPLFLYKITGSSAASAQLLKSYFLLGDGSIQAVSASP